MWFKTGVNFMTASNFLHQNGLVERGHAVADRALERMVIIIGIVLIPVVIMARVELRHKEFRDREYLHLFDRNATNEETTGDQNHTNSEQPLQLEVEITLPDPALDIPSSLPVAPTPDLAVQHCDAQNKSETGPQEHARLINLDNENTPSHHHQPIPSTTMEYKVISSVGSSNS